MSVAAALLLVMTWQLASLEALQCWDVAFHFLVGGKNTLEIEGTQRRLPKLKLTLTKIGSSSHQMIST
jgi:hypothetical protein